MNCGLIVLMSSLLAFSSSSSGGGATSAGDETGTSAETSADETGSTGGLPDGEPDCIGGVAILEPRGGEVTSPIDVSYDLGVQCQDGTVDWGPLTLTATAPGFSKSVPCTGPCTIELPPGDYVLTLGYSVSFISSGRVEVTVVEEVDSTTGSDDGQAEGVDSTTGSDDGQVEGSESDDDSNGGCRVGSTRQGAGLGMLLVALAGLGRRRRAGNRPLPPGRHDEGPGVTSNSVQHKSVRSGVREAGRRQAGRLWTAFHVRRNSRSPRRSHTLYRTSQEVLVTAFTSGNHPPVLGEACGLRRGPGPRTPSP